MIAYKSIPVEKSDELNKFIAKNPPLANMDKGDAGISLHNGFFIVRYEDGTFNEKELFRTNILQALNTNKSNIVVKTIECSAASSELKGMFPSLTLDEIKAKPRSYFVEFYQGKKLSYKHASELTDKIDFSKSTIVLAETEIERTKNVNIPVLEALLEAHA
jgi:hypothetical protein